MSDSLLRRRRRRGLTLIEMLIAITLVSLLSTGILYAMRLGLGALEQTNRKFTDNRRVLGSLRVLYEQLAGVVPAQVPCGGARNQTELAPLFFQGTQNSLQFVSNYTLEEAARGYPRIVEYFVTPGDAARGGGVRLVMQETPYTGPFSVMPYCTGQGADPLLRAPTALLRPVQMGPRPFVIADQLAYCRISYLRIHPSTFQGNWETAYSGAVLPGAVKVEMAPLRPDPSRVQLGTTTIPLHVSRNTYEPYADIEIPQQ
jgi:prepilin-type N-terminal cleavage/methylation domain-containing protein